MRKSNGRWYIRFKLDGVEYNAKTGLEATEQNRIRALQMEAALRQKVIDGKADVTKLKAHPFSSAAKHFLEWAKGEYKKPNTYRRIASSFAFMKEYFGGRNVASITPGHLESFKVKRRNMSVKEISIRHDLHALSLFFQWAVKHGYARENIVRKVDIPSAEDAVRINPLSPEQEKAYLRACIVLDAAVRSESQTKNRPQAEGYSDLADFARLMIQQGCRPEEFLELEKSAVDLEHGWLYIRSGKTRSARRRLKLTRESIEILERRLKSPGPWVFPGPWDPQKHRTTFQRVHDEVVRESGVKCVIYDLRHTFASRAAADGVPLPTLAAMLGHSPRNMRSVAHYVHVSASNIDAEMERLEKMRAERKEAQE